MICVTDPAHVTDPAQRKGPDLSPHTARLEASAEAGAAPASHAWLGDALPDVRLSKAQSRVVDVIARNPQLSSYADIAEIAQRADVNNSTVVRAAQHLGYRGWPDLQRELRSR